MARLYAQSFEQAQHFHGLNDACPVVMCALAQIPGVQVATNQDNFFGAFAPPDFANDVVRKRVGQGAPVGFEVDLQIRLAFERMAQVAGIVGADGQRRDLWEGVGIDMVPVCG